MVTTLSNICDWCDKQLVTDEEVYMSHSQMLGKFKYGLPAKF